MRRVLLLSIALLFALPAGAAAPQAAKAPAVSPATKKPARAPLKRPVRPKPVRKVTAPVVPPRDPWQEARDMADRGQLDSALVFLRAETARDPQAFDLLWLEAGLTGKSGDVAGAVQRYESLSAAFPDQAPRLADDLLRWRLEAADARTSIVLLRSWLPEHPDDMERRIMLAGALARADQLDASAALYDSLRHERPGDTELALRHAQVLGWRGRHREAIAAYDDILEHEPDNAEARFGRAANLNWSGRHRVATRELAQLAAAPDADPETFKSLAFARYWDDDPDGALEALDRYEARRADDAEAQGLRERIARERRATLELGFGRSDDSDGLDVTTPSIELRFPVAPRTTGMLGWRNDLTQDAGGKADVMRLSAGLSHQLDASLRVYGRYSADSWDSRLGTHTGGELGVIDRPIDHLRLEVVAARDPIVTRTSLEGGHSLLQWVFAADWSGIPRVQLHADGRAGFYSDGNRSERTSASVNWDTWSDARWDLSTGLSVDQLNVHQDLAHGYYDPDFHREWGPRMQIGFRPDERWRIRSDLKTGWQREKGGLAETFYGLSARIAYLPDADWVLSLEGGRGDSNLQTAAGYRREWWQCTVTRAF